MLTYAQKFYLQCTLLRREVIAILILGKDMISIAGKLWLNLHHCCVGIRSRILSWTCRLTNKQAVEIIPPPALIPDSIGLTAQSRSGAAGWYSMKAPDRY